MKFSVPLTPAIFLKRYKRFFADVEINGQKEVAHIPNTGSLKSCLKEGMNCLVSPASDPQRKLRWTLEMVQPDQHWVGVNTQRPNSLVKELIQNVTHDPSRYPHLKHWSAIDKIESEVKISKESRLDLCLHRGIHRHYVEIKNVTFKNGDLALFPDAVSTRATKHLEELRELRRVGHEVELVFVVQRQDCSAFSVAHEIDPTYAFQLRKNLQEGLRVTPLVCALNANEIALTPQLLPLEQTTLNI